MPAGVGWGWGVGEDVPAASRYITGRAAVQAIGVLGTRLCIPIMRICRHQGRGAPMDCHVKYRVHSVGNTVCTLLPASPSRTRPSSSTRTSRGLHRAMAWTWHALKEGPPHEAGRTMPVRQEIVRSLDGRKGSGACAQGEAGKCVSRAFSLEGMPKEGRAILPNLILGEAPDQAGPEPVPSSNCSIRGDPPSVQHSHPSSVRGP